MNTYLFMIFFAILFKVAIFRLFVLLFKMEKEKKLPDAGCPPHEYLNEPIDTECPEIGNYMVCNRCGYLPECDSFSYEIKGVLSDE